MNKIIRGKTISFQYWTYKGKSSHMKPTAIVGKITYVRSQWHNGLEYPFYFYAVNKKTGKKEQYFTEFVTNVVPQ